MPELHDPSNIDVRAVSWGAAAILGGVAFALTAAWFAWQHLRPAGAQPPARVAIAAPVLETKSELAPYLREKAARRDSYGWVDRQGGIAHIPVERAMALLAARKGQP